MRNGADVGTNAFGNGGETCPRVPAESSRGGSSSDIRRAAFGRTSKQIKGWCKKNSVRTRHSLLPVSSKGQNATVKSNRADRKRSVKDSRSSTRAEEGSGWGRQLLVLVLHGPQLLNGRKESRMKAERGREDGRCEDLRRKRAHLCTEAE